MGHALPDRGRLALCPTKLLAPFSKLDHFTTKLPSGRSLMEDMIGGGCISESLSTFVCTIHFGTPAFFLDFLIHYCLHKQMDKFL